MTEKVLGFKEEEIVAQNKATYVVDKERLVPVRLKSESVDLKWLEKELRKRISVVATLNKAEIRVPLLKSLNALLSIAKKEAGK